MADSHCAYFKSHSVGVHVKNGTSTFVVLISHAQYYRSCGQSFSVAIKYGRDLKYMYLTICTN